MASTELVVLGAAFWLLWAGTNGVIAAEKNRSFGRIFLASLVFSPFIGYLYILAVPAKPEVRRRAARTEAAEETLQVPRLRISIGILITLVVILLGIIFVLRPAIDRWTN